MTGLAPPDGFAVVRRGGAALVADAGWLERLVAAGLDAEAEWRRALAGPSAAPGRGATAVVDLAGGGRLRLKALRRGGALAAVWRDRFVGTSRLAANLTVPLTAIARGVSTPAPRALLLVPGPPGLARGFLGVDEIDHARDLASLLALDDPPPDAVVLAVVDAIRAMHDAGVEHRDLNLGNVVAVAGSDGPSGAVLDLDAGRLHDGPLAEETRARALVRLERSHRKLEHRGAPGAGRLDPTAWGDRYATLHPAVGQALLAARRRAGAWLPVRRLTWG